MVTPSYEQAAFLEETIRTVLLQGYPDLEYWVMDGGSTDGSVEIIRKYAPWLAGWVSEKDRGQTQAINKGMERASGDVLAYLNSDDTYLPGALMSIGQEFANSTTDDWLIGATDVMNERGDFVHHFVPLVNDDLSHWVAHSVSVPQPSTFFSRKAQEKVGRFDEAFTRCMDQEYWARLAVFGFRPRVVPQVLARFRLHTASKTCGAPPMLFFEEDIQICQKYLTQLDGAGRLFAERFVRATRAHIARWEVYRRLPEGRGSMVTALGKALWQQPALLRDRATWGLLRRLAVPAGLRRLGRELGLDDSR